RKGREFRLEHMDKGPELIRRVTDEYIKDGLLEEEDLHLVCRAVVIHDYPSIEQNLNILRELSIRERNKTKDAYITKGTLDRLTEVAARYEEVSFLLPFDDPAIGRLITFLREADRLFMISVQGVIKDLKENKEIDTIDTKAVIERARKNIKSHESEYELYSQAGKDDGKFKDDGNIKNKSLYRTDTGYNTIFDEAK
ncbi:MAG: hypothetical protein ACFFCW_48505, partial [Candidatus Hodarchaeota archaeon]